MPRRGTRGERHLALFLLGLVLLSPPLLSIFNGPGWLFGIPLLYIYLFAAWGTLIGLTALTSERWRRVPGHRPQTGCPEAPRAETLGKTPHRRDTPHQGTTRQDRD